MVERINMAEANALLKGHYLGPVTYSPVHSFTTADRRAVAVYSSPIAAAFKKSIPGSLELARLFKFPDAPFETSQFLAASLRWLRENTDAPCVFSYADPAQAHDGGIYKATGFKFLMDSRATDKWQTPSGRVVSAPQGYRLFRTKSRADIKKLRPRWGLIKGEPKLLFLFPLRKKLGPTLKALGFDASCPADEPTPIGVSAAQPREEAPIVRATMASKALVRQGVANPWTSKILRAWASTIEGFFEVGRLLSKAKSDLGHGEFLAMVERDLPFGPRMAQMLMAVAADPRLNANPGSLLPPSITTLYLLSRLDDLSFKRALARGDIHPEMDRRAAGSLLHKTQRLLSHRRASEQNVRPGISLWYVDPPWRPERHRPPYRTMTLDRIRGLRLGSDGKASTKATDLSIAEASASCAACAIWTIDEYLHEAESLLGAWGFEFVTPRLIWHKSSHVNAGKAALHAHEYLLIGVKGGAVPTWKPQSVISASRSRHSEKPEQFRTMLEKMFPLLVDRCELFARKRHDGWTGWGDQLPAA